MRNFVYIIGTTDKGGPRTYVGWTTDIEGRLNAHNSGKGAKATRGRSWRLIYAELYPTRGQAMSREWHLKRDRKLRDEILDSLRPPNTR